MNTSKNLKSGILSGAVAAIIYAIAAALITRIGFGGEIVFSSLITGAIIVGAITFLITFVVGAVISARKQAIKEAK
jgi:hypothetical protein